jgi:hypothetical protein
MNLRLQTWGLLSWQPRLSILLVALALVAHPFWCAANCLAHPSESGRPRTALTVDTAGRAPGPCLAAMRDQPFSPHEDWRRLCCGNTDEQADTPSLTAPSLARKDGVLTAVVAALFGNASILLPSDSVLVRDGPEPFLLLSHLRRNSLLGRAPPHSL